MDRGAWRATVHGVSEHQTWLSTHAHILIVLKTSKMLLFFFLHFSHLENPHESRAIQSVYHSNQTIPLKKGSDTY